MPVRIGNIEIVGLQRIHAEDARSLVQQRGPGQAGSVTQDLGRQPVTIVMEGVLLGKESRNALTELRDAHRQGTPLSFASDAIAGSDLTEVLIADLRVQQLAGYPDHFQFFMRVREYTQPPENPAAEAASVQQDIDAEADAWEENAVASSNALTDPGALMDTALTNPELLANIDSGELGSFLTDLKDQITGGDFGTILSTLAKIDPAKALALINELKNAGSLSEFIQKLADEGIDLLEDLTGLDLGAAKALLEGVAGAGDFLDKLKKVKDLAAALVGNIGALDPAALVKPGASPPSSSPATVVSNAAALVKAIADLLQAQTTKAIVELLGELGIEEQVKTGIQAIREGVTACAGALAPIKETLVQVDSLSVAFELMVSMTGSAIEAVATTLGELGIPGTSGIASGVAEVIAGMNGVFEFSENALALLPTDQNIAELEESFEAMGAALSEFEQTLSKPA